MRSPLSLLLTGLGLLVASLLLNMWRVASAEGGPTRLYDALVWATQATLFVGAGLVVAGAALRVLRR